MTNHPVKKYPVIGACGLDCGLCPNFHRDSKSRCPGCCGAGFWDVHPSCPFITCCVKQKGLETCGQCNEFEFCPRVMKQIENAKRADSIISYKPIPTNFEYIHKYGIEKWAAYEKEKIAFLTTLLADYNDGRSKTFYCLSVQLLPLDKLKTALAQAQKKMATEMTLKDRAKVVRYAYNELAAKSGVELKLRSGKPSKT